MFPLQLLGPPFADHRALRIQVPVLGAPAVRIKTTNPKGREQRFEFQQGPIRTAANGIGHDPARLMIERLSQPPRLFLAADKRPHFVYRRLLHLTNHHHGGCSLTTRHQGRVHLIERRRFFLRMLITVIGQTPSTRAVSRMPLPLSARSITCRRISGTRLRSW